MNFSIRKAVKGLLNDAPSLIQEWKAINKAAARTKQMYIDKGDDPEWVASECKRGVRKMRIEAVGLFFVNLLLWLFALSIFAPCYIVFGSMLRLADTPVGIMFGLYTERSFDYELYNRRGQLHPDGPWDGFRIASRGYSTRFKGYKGNWTQIDLTSNKRPETNEMLIAEYLRFDPIRHLLVTNEVIKYYFLGIKLWTERRYDYLDINNDVKDEGVNEDEDDDSY